jgi:hypothetical protein
MIIKRGLKFINFCKMYSILAYVSHYMGSRDSAVSIATVYGLDNREVGVRVPVGSRIFSSLSRPDLL